MKNVDAKVRKSFENEEKTKNLLSGHFKTTPSKLIFFSPNFKER